MIAWLLACASAPDQDAIRQASLYDLDLELETPAGARPLDLHRGHPVLLSMMYTSCSGVCPTTISRLQGIEDCLPLVRRGDLRVVLVSLDPARDGPDALADLAVKHGLDERWTVARVPSDKVRELSAVLGVRYRQLPDGEIDHSTVLVLLDENGVVRDKVEGPDRSTDALVERLGGT